MHTDFYKSDEVDILLHGRRHGVDSPFMQAVIQAGIKAERNLIAFDFPYILEGTDQPSSELKAEISALRNVIDLALSLGARKFRLVGKSLGGIVASMYLAELSAEETDNYSAVVLGYAAKYIDFGDFSGEITVIQGSEDDHGDAAKIREYLSAQAPQASTEVIEIAGADHSFRGPQGDQQYVPQMLTHLY